LRTVGTEQTLTKVETNLREVSDGDTLGHAMTWLEDPPPCLYLFYFNSETILAALAASVF